MFMYIVRTCAYVHVHVCAHVHAAAKLIILLSPWAGPGLDFPEHVGTV